MLVRFSSVTTFQSSPVRFSSAQFSLVHSATIQFRTAGEWEKPPYPSEALSMLLSQFSSIVSSSLDSQLLERAVKRNQFINLEKAYDIIWEWRARSTLRNTLRYSRWRLWARVMGAPRIILAVDFPRSVIALLPRPAQTKLTSTKRNENTLLQISMKSRR